MDSPRLSQSPFFVLAGGEVVSLAAVVGVGPKLALHQRLLTRTIHSIPASDQ